MALSQSPSVSRCVGVVFLRRTVRFLLRVWFFWSTCRGCWHSVPLVAASVSRLHQRWIVMLVVNMSCKWEVFCCQRFGAVVFFFSCSGCNCSGLYDFKNYYIMTSSCKLSNWGFLRTWYERKTWLAGCEAASTLFCYTGTLFRPRQTPRHGQLQESPTCILFQKRSRNTSPLRPTWTAVWSFLRLGGWTSQRSWKRATD